MFKYETPLHIQEEIMKRLPVKSLIQSRSVSKKWKSLIDGSEFIAAHALHRHTKQQLLLVSYKEMEEGVKCVSYIDDDTTLRQKSVLTPPPYVKQLRFPTVLGSSHGLLCLYGDNFTHLPKTRMIILWNPAIRKSFVLAVPCKRYFGKPNLNDPILDRQCIGFGVCPVTTDPKIVSITQSWDRRNIETSYRCTVIVYALSFGKWRNLSTTLPAEPFEIHSWRAITTDKFIYWYAVLRAHYIIMSFDVTNETFEAIDLPDSLPRHDNRILHISKLREYLAILQSDANEETVWIMEGGVQRLFTKLFTIKKTPHRYIMGFRKSGTPLMQVRDGNWSTTEKLVVYEPNLEHNNVIGITKSQYPFRVNPYMETLLLLGQPDSGSY